MPHVQLPSGSKRASGAALRWRFQRPAHPTRFLGKETEFPAAPGETWLGLLEYLEDVSH
jgi:hypothetical protein